MFVGGHPNFMYLNGLTFEIREIVRAVGIIPTALTTDYFEKIEFANLLRIDLKIHENHAILFDKTLGIDLTCRCRFRINRLWQQLNTEITAYLVGI